MTAPFRAAATVLALVAGCGFQIEGAAPADGRDDAPRDAVPDQASVDAAIDAPPAATCAAGDPALRACYQFEGDLVDGSSYANNGTALNASYGPGHTGTALNTLAVSTTVPMNPTAFNINEFTLGMWVRASAVAVVRAGLLDSIGFRIFVENGNRIRCAINNGLDAITTDSIGLGSWVHVVCTYDGTLRVYFDGVEKAAATHGVAIVANTTQLTIGHNEPTGENFAGQIDQLEIWSKVIAP